MEAKFKKVYDSELKQVGRESVPVSYELNY